MFKKIALILYSIATCAISMEAPVKKVDAFSDEISINRWLAQKHNHKIQFIQDCLYLEDPKNPDFLKSVTIIDNNDGDDRGFGRTFYALKDAQLLFLEHVHQISMTTNPRTLELAAGNANVTWKIPYALENDGEVYVNELSKKMVRKIESCLKDKLDETLLGKFKILQGDCFDILKNSPELAGTFHVIYCQNLEHFFNPIQHQAFLTLITQLLAPGGKAFLISDTINVVSVRNKAPDFILYEKQKKTDDMYPLFTTCVARINSNGMPEVSKAYRPVDGKMVGAILLDYGYMEVTGNYLTPSIYKKAIEPHSDLEHEDSFFMDYTGNRFNTYDEKQNIKSAVAIIKKKI